MSHVAPTGAGPAVIYAVVFSALLVMGAQGLAGRYSLDALITRWGAVVAPARLARRGPRTRECFQRELKTWPEGPRSPAG